MSQLASPQAAPSAVPLGVAVGGSALQVAMDAVVATQQEAALALRGASSPDPTLCAQAGLPNAGTALRLWEALDRQLWSVA